jgi:cytochrome oxidase Cu insertion factor (SCO1/SenC/PrrC family)
MALGPGGAVLLAAITGLGAPPGAEAHDISQRGAQDQPRDGVSEARIVIDESDGTRFKAPRPGTYRLPVIKPGVDGDVLGTDGRRRRIFDVIGDRIALVSFIYTRCADARGCPLAVTVFYEVEDMMAADPDLARNMRLLSLSFDPDHDTPSVMADYSGYHSRGEAGAARLWEFLTTASQKELGPILDGYGQYVVAERDDTGQPIGAFSHVLKVFLLDRARRVRNIYSTSFLYPQLIASDVKTLLLEEAGEEN